MTGGEGVSVVIPVRDGEAHLAEAVRSALGQRRPPTEVIVVDDGSSDGSGDVARALGVTVIEQPPLGPGAARNRGVAHAGTSLIAFLDGDDRMTADRLDIQVGALAGDPGLDGALGLMRRFSSGRPPTGDPEPCLLPSALLVRRQAFVDSGGFDPDLPAGEFVDWLTRCRQAGRRLAVLDAVVVERRAHDGNLTRDLEQVRAGYLAVARSAIDRHRRAAAISPDDLPR
jgi:glycosyltransferase involved in cell wall biosynthesis